MCLRQRHGSKGEGGRVKSNGLGEGPVGTSDLYAKA